MAEAGFAKPPDAPAGAPAGERPEGEGTAGAAAADGDAAGGAAERPSRGALEIADEQARLRRDELLDPIDDALARQLKRVLQDEQNEVLDRMRRKRRRHRESPLLSADEHAGRYREAAESVLNDAMRAGARFADTGDGGVRVDGRAVREAAEALARELTQPLRQRLERALADAGGDSDGPDAAESVSLVYRQWRSQELEPLARHYAVLAFSGGSYGNYADATSLRWIVDDAAPCPDCDDNALAGAVVKGEAYPTGQLHPPAHPGCRCLLVPAVP